MSRVAKALLSRMALTVISLALPILWNVYAVQAAQTDFRAPAAPAGSTVVRDEPSGQALRQGSWICRSPKNILGMGADRIITLKQTGKKWQISFCSLLYSRFGAAPRIQQTGPYALQAQNGILTIEQEQGIVRQTYRFDTDGLVTPALVKTAPLDWHMLWTVRSSPSNGKLGETSYFETALRCLDNFHSHANGPAQFWMGHAGQNPRPDQTPAGQVYVYKQEQDREGRLWNVLHFYEGARADGTPREEAKLLWNDAGATRIQASPYYGRADVYTPMRQADIDALLHGE